jgi:hypothetical protein
LTFVLFSDTFESGHCRQTAIMMMVAQIKTAHDMFSLRYSIYYSVFSH